MSVAAGTYSVNLDCTATISLATGSSFDAIIAGGGTQVLFVETDSTGTGSTGILERASSCVSLSYPQRFGFSFSGALQAAASTTGTGHNHDGSGAIHAVLAARHHLYRWQRKFHLHPDCSHEWRRIARQSGRDL